MKSAIIISTLLLVSSGGISAQQSSSSAVQDEHPIQDNSFLAEEAYNQEPGVVQHIQAFTRLWNSRAWAYSFTQEWPVPNHWRHQLSYTLQGARTDATLDRSFGDLLLNYRYQLTGSGDTRLAVSPRATLIVPTGSVKNGSGYGGTGVQAVVPASYVLNRRFVTHYDLGGTIIPRARDASDDVAASYGYNAAGSLVWLAHSRLNGMFETSWSSAHLVSRPNGTDVQNTLWLAPGARGAFNFKSGLQIVPGIAYVAGVGPSSGDKGVFFYLSFEHPLWREAER
ncbi:MAG: transporter [Acidobacteria bacterium]|nr:transporter [Acidobacteriota bacterium]